VPGGAKPDPQGVYPPKGLRLEREGGLVLRNVMVNYVLIEGAVMSR
jgi:hypothetical protein